MSGLNVSAINSVGTNSTVVRSLGSGVPILGPAEGTLLQVEERVLLLDTKPGLGAGSLLHHLGALLPLVGGGGLVLVVVGVAHHQDVVTLGEGAGLHLDGLQVGVRVLSVGLVAGAAIIVPHREILHLGWFGVQTLDLGSETFSCSINPDIGGADSLTLGKTEILLQDILICC